MELTCCISLDICLPKTVLFPAYEEEEGRDERKKRRMRGRLRSRRRLTIPVYGGGSASSRHSLHCRSPH